MGYINFERAAEFQRKLTEIKGFRSVSYDETARRFDIKINGKFNPEIKREVDKVVKSYDVVVSIEFISEDGWDE